MKEEAVSVPVVYEMNSSLTHVHSHFFFALNQMFYGHDSSCSWLAWFQANISLWKDFLKHQLSESMGNSLPELEPLKKLAVTDDRQLKP